tara:strand:- start:1736 stop:3328 length:1593 start_codon:yes stop_codon:yes gene_type:complete
MRRTTLFLLVITLSFLPSCYKSETEEKPAYGGHLTIGHYAPIDIINPIVSNSGTSGFLTEIIFNGLVKPDEKFNILPDLAYKWETSKDGFKWRFYLREGVKFHNNIELTAEDVKFTYDLIKNPGHRGYYTQFFEPINKINIIDRHTIEIVLNQPYTPLLSGLTVGILPKHIYEGRNLRDLEVNKQPVGTGPFKVLNYSSSKAVLTANKDYFNGRSYLDKIIFRIFKNQDTLFAKMMDETVDVIYDSNPENIDILKQVTYFKHYKFLRPFYYILAFQNKGILKDKRVRTALNYAVNKKQLLKNVLKNDGKVAFGTVYPGSWAYSKKIGPYPYNPRKALKLLSEAGWKDTNDNHILDKDGVELGFTVLFLEEFAVEEESLKHIQVDLNNIGVSMKANKYSIERFNEFLMRRKFDAILIDLVSRGDPDNSYKFWHSSQIEKGRNFFSYKNEKIDKLLEEGRRVSDIDLRKKLYYQFQEEIFNDPPGIFLFWTNHLIMVHERFKGVKMHPSWVLDLKDWYVPEGSHQRTEDRER